jgi:hypothetical protein
VTPVQKIAERFEFDLQGLSDIVDGWPHRARTVSNSDTPSFTATGRGNRACRHK